MIRIAEADMDALFIQVTAASKPDAANLLRMMQSAAEAAGAVCGEPEEDGGVPVLRFPAYGMALQIKQEDTRQRIAVRAADGTDAAPAETLDITLQTQAMYRVQAVRGEGFISFRLAGPFGNGLWDYAHIATFLTGTVCGTAAEKPLYLIGDTSPLYAPADSHRAYALPVHTAIPPYDTRTVYLIEAYDTTYAIKLNDAVQYGGDMLSTGRCYRFGGRTYYAVRRGFAVG